jgi:hypothetical protein
MLLGFLVLVQNGVNGNPVTGESLWFAKYTSQYHRFRFPVGTQY